MLNKEEIFAKWYAKFAPKKIKNNLQFQAQYLHFDQKIPTFGRIKDKEKRLLKYQESLRKDFEKISLVENVEKWRFVPFIKMSLPKYKIKIVSTKNTDPKKRIYQKRSQTNPAKIKQLDKGKREIMYCSHSDRLLYSYYGILLEQKYESKLANLKLVNSDSSQCILAYRTINKTDNNGKLSGKCNLDFAKDAFKIIQDRRLEDVVVLAFDIKGFFDNIDHNLLGQAWATILEVQKLPLDHYKIFQSLTKYSFFNRQELFRQVLNLSKFSSRNNSTISKIITPQRKLKRQTLNGRFNFYPSENGKIKIPLTSIPKDKTKFWEEIKNMPKFGENLRNIIVEAKRLDKELYERKMKGFSLGDNFILEKNYEPKKRQLEFRKVHQ